MPFTYEIDRERRRLMVQISGVFTEEDIRQIIDIARLPENCRLDLLADLSNIDHIDYQSSTQILGIVKQAAKTDSQEQRTRFAIVVSRDADFGLSRMYQSYREAQPGANREVKIFRSLDEALAWLSA